MQGDYKISPGGLNGEKNGETEVDERRQIVTKQWPPCISIKKLGKRLADSASRLSHDVSLLRYHAKSLAEIAPVGLNQRSPIDPRRGLKLLEPIYFLLENR